MIHGSPGSQLGLQAREGWRCLPGPRGVHHVFTEEPPVDLELLELSNLMVTPHIGGNAYEAKLVMGRSAIEGIRQYMLL